MPASVELMLPLPAEKHSVALERIQSLFGSSTELGGGGNHGDAKATWGDATSGKGLTARMPVEEGDPIRIHALLMLSNASGALVGQAVLAVLPPSVAFAGAPPPSGAEQPDAALITPGGEPKPFQADVSVKGKRTGRIRGIGSVKWVRA